MTFVFRGSVEDTGTWGFAAVRAVPRKVIENHPEYKNMKMGTALVSMEAVDPLANP